MHSPQCKLIYYIVFLCLSSCTAFRPIISKKSELTEADLRAKIIPGKTYLFELKSGQKLKVEVAKADSINIYGVLRIVSKGKGKQEWVPFTESYSRLYTNVASVRMKEKAPGRTITLFMLVILPAAGAIGMLIALLIIYS